MRIAVIGANIAGLSCADALVGRGHEVALFDKGRGPGGRTSTRRVEAGRRTLRFDHGAQYFTARDPAFAAQVARWERDGVAARWRQAGADAWVGTPGMNAPVKAMTAAHAVAWAVWVDALERDGDRWRLRGAPEPKRFDAVVVATPAEQATPLLRSAGAEFAELAAQTRSAPCWTALVGFAEPIATERRVIRDAGPIGWAAHDGAKPGRDGAATWVVQASPEWSTEHLEDTPEKVGPELLRLLEAELGMPLHEPIHLSAHRWRYARSGGAGGPGALWDAALRVGACGDWLLAPRVEAGWLSGRQLADLTG